MGDASTITLALRPAKPSAPPPPPPNETPNYIPRYIDIGINLADPVFRGIHKDKDGNDKTVHKDDHADVVARAITAGCKVMIVTGSSLSTSQDAVQQAKDYPRQIYATIGIHPCSCMEIENASNPADHLSKIESLAVEAKANNQAVAFGEIGLDYDRLYHASKDIQIKYFEAQLEIASKLALPLFLHSRAAHQDFIRLLKEHNPLHNGVVHSFTGTVEEMKELVELGYDIGINGCSLKTEENVELVRQLDLGHLHLETDGPWCEMRPTHESSKYLKGWTDSWVWKKKEKWVEGNLVKGRNESCLIGKVAWAVAAIKGVSVERVCEAAWDNSVRLFGLEGDLDEKTTAGEGNIVSGAVTAREEDTAANGTVVTGGSEAV